MTGLTSDVDNRHTFAVAHAGGSTEKFRGSRFVGADFVGATFRECDLREVRIVGSALAGATVSGAIDHLVVNDVDVAAFVEAELDRRHPERAWLREVETAGDHRDMWDAIELLWSDTTARAQRLEESLRHERVRDEWSFVETLRHLVFATDLWLAHMILERPLPYHRLALPPTDYPSEGLAALGLALDAGPSYAEVMQARTERMALVREVVDRLTDDQLERTCLGQLPAAWQEEALPVRRCLRVVMNEEVEHHRYAVRDLATLEAR